MIMSTLATLAPAGRASPVATLCEATPARAWELYRERRLDLHRVAARLGISRSDVLALVAAHKPVADAQEFERMRRAGEPTYAMVDPRARDTYVRMGHLLGVRERDPVRRTWGEGNGQKLADRLGAAFYVEGDDLWLWPPGASTEDEQRETAAGIRILPDGGGYDVLDGWQRKVGTLATLKAAQAMAGRMMAAASATSGG